MQFLIPALNSSQGVALTGSMLIILFVEIILGIAAYIYGAVCLMVIAKKTNTPNGWLAWIPIANIYLMLKIADKPIWWLILIFIPCINFVWIVLGIFVWMAIAERRGHPSWWGILTIVPLVGIVVPGYIAFVDPK